jgi:hypothetical protein
MNGVRNLHPASPVFGGIPKGEQVSHGRSPVDRTHKTEVHHLRQAGIYSHRGAVIADVLSRLVATA